jgi:hypothetical protein
MHHIHPSPREQFPLDDLGPACIRDALALLCLIRAGVAPRNYIVGQSSTTPVIDLYHAGYIHIREFVWDGLLAVEVTR